MTPIIKPKALAATIRSERAANRARLFANRTWQPYRWGWDHRLSDVFPTPSPGPVLLSVALDVQGAELLTHLVSERVIHQHRLSLRSPADEWELGAVGSVEFDGEFWARGIVGI